MSLYTDYAQDPSGNPKFYGIYQGKVVNNFDSESKYRLSIIVPQVTGGELIEEVSACLPPINSDLLEIPDIGDIVWIMFESGNVSHPIWIGKGL